MLFFNETVERRSISRTPLEQRVVNFFSLRQSITSSQGQLISKRNNIILKIIFILQVELFRDKSKYCTSVALHLCCDDALRNVTL